MKRLIGLIPVVLFLCCTSKNLVTDYSDSELVVTPLKWYGNHRGVVSITYDATYGPSKGYIDVVDAVRQRRLKMDIEMVTDYFDRPENRYLIDIIHNDLIPSGIHFFGHGHKHINHDAISEDSAYASFKKCYDLMSQWDLHPDAYAYPGCAGYKEQTQRANRKAGFICARGVTYNENNFYICPDDQVEPINWFFLPSVPIVKSVSNCIRNHGMISDLLQKTLVYRAWVILMYHSIGNLSANDYYPMEDFTQDLDQIRDGDFWSANLESAAKYIQERNAFHVEYQPALSDTCGNAFQISFGDSLDNSVYNQPLTVQIQFCLKKQLTHCRFSPAVESGSDFEVIDNTAVFDVLPDEKTYLMEVY